jgi:hypothetical protein
MSSTLNLASSVIRTRPRRRRKQPATILGGLITLMVGSFVLAFMIHVAGHWHAAILRREMRHPQMTQMPEMGNLQQGGRGHE